MKRESTNRRQDNFVPGFKQLGGGLGAEPDELEKVTELSLDPDRQQKMGGWP